MLSPISIVVVHCFPSSTFGIDNKQVLNIWKCLFSELNPLLMGALNGTHCAFESPAEEYISGVKQNPSIRSMLAHYCALKDSAQPVKDGLCAQCGKNESDSGFISSDSVIR